MVDEQLHLFLSGVFGPLESIKNLAQSIIIISNLYLKNQEQSLGMHSVGFYYKVQKFTLISNFCAGGIDLQPPDLHMPTHFCTLSKVSSSVISCNLPFIIES